MATSNGGRPPCQVMLVGVHSVTFAGALTVSALVTPEKASTKPKTSGRDERAS